MPGGKVGSRRWGRTLAAILLGGACGCANTFDTLTSRTFHKNLVDKPIETLFVPPDPVTVLRDANADGDERAKAMRRLEEPGAANPQLQDEVLGILTKAATADDRPVCRLAAIETLGRFEDPRATAALVSAYHQAGAALPTNPSGLQLTSAGLPTGAIGFPLETVTVIRSRTIAKLGESKQPGAVELLAEVARKPVESTLSTTEQQMARDVKLAAVRALANFPANARAAQALVGVLQSDRDVAVRNRASESLMAITGQDFGDDAARWSDYLKQYGEQLPAPPKPSVIQRVGGWFTN